jgi:YD repeat-containing protein
LWSGSAFTAGAGDAFLERAIEGSRLSAAGTQITSFSGVAIEPLYVIDGKSTAQTSVRDGLGRTVFDATEVYSGGNWVQVSSMTHVYNDEGRKTSTAYSDGTAESWVWDGADLESHTTREGVTTSYTYDDLGRTDSMTVAAVSGVVPEQVTVFAY